MSADNHSVDSACPDVFSTECVTAVQRTSEDLTRDVQTLRNTPPPNCMQRGGDDLSDALQSYDADTKRLLSALRDHDANGVNNVNPVRMADGQRFNDAIDELTAESKNC